MSLFFARYSATAWRSPAKNGYVLVLTQVLHHLAVVIISVGRCESGNRHPRAEPVDRFDATNAFSGVIVAIALCA